MPDKKQTEEEAVELAEEMATPPAPERTLDAGEPSVEPLTPEEITAVRDLLASKKEKK